MDPDTAMGWWKVANEIGLPWVLAGLFAYVAYLKDKRVDTVTDRHREDAVLYAQSMEQSASALRESNTTNRDLLEEVRHLTRIRGA